jgi:hypothetical protein
VAGKKRNPSKVQVLQVASAFSTWRALARGSVVEVVVITFTTSIRERKSVESTWMGPRLWWLGMKHRWLRLPSKRLVRIFI